MGVSDGRACLIAYLRRHQVRQGELAERLGVKASMISFWVNGKRRPSLDSAFALEAITDGEIPAALWSGRRRKAS